MTSTQPGGAMVGVFSDSPDGTRFLLLHTSELELGDDLSDWAWGAPSGCLEPGEDIAGCAARELFEETGIRGEPDPVLTEDVGWAVFTLQVAWGTPVTLSFEHNDFAWVSLDEALARCRPERLAVSIRTAVAAITERLG